VTRASATTSTTEGWPVVRVPVLSKAMALTRARVSRWTPPSDKNAGARGGGERRDDAHGRGDHQRAGAGDHQQNERLGGARLGRRQAEADDGHEEDEAVQRGR
jgi:hypothetical protein